MRVIARFLLFSVYSVLIYLLLMSCTLLLLPTKYGQFFNYSFGLKGNLDLRLSQIDTLHQVDVLILGASDAYRGYDPRIFAQQNIRCFNLGSSVQTPIQTEILLQRYLKKIQPKLVIYNVHTSLLTNTGTEASGDLIFHAPFGHELWDLVSKTKNLKVFHTWWLKKSMNLVGHNEPIPGRFVAEDEYIDGGYVINHNFHQMNFSEGPENKISLPKIDYQVQAFENNIQLFRSLNIPFLLVEAPKIQHSDTFVNNSDTIAKWFSPYGPLIHANKLAAFTDSVDFYDCQHLSLNGVTKYNLALLPLIQLQLQKISQ
jgi:hypothetical protein